MLWMLQVLEYYHLCFLLLSPCVRYTCTPSHGLYSWVKTLVDECCQTCDGEVYAGGAVIGVHEEGGVCGTTVTTECVAYGSKDGNLLN